MSHHDRWEFTRPALMFACSDCGADANMEHASGRMLCVPCAIAEDAHQEREYERRQDLGVRGSTCGSDCGWCGACS